MRDNLQKKFRNCLHGKPARNIKKSILVPPIEFNRSKKFTEDAWLRLDAVVKCFPDFYSAKIEQYNAHLDWIDKYDPWVEYWRKEINGFHPWFFLQCLLMAGDIMGDIVCAIRIIIFIINY